MNKSNLEIAARLLEKYGYLKKVAGKNFDKACEVVVMMHETNRGAIVSGACGVGKSCFCQAVAKIFGCQYFIDMKEPISSGWFTDEEHTMKLLNATVCLDDVGCERVINIYGDRMESLGNFTKRYTPRVTDRLLEICVAWKMEGKSKRKAVIVKITRKDSKSHLFPASRRTSQSFRETQVHLGLEGQCDCGGCR